MNDPINPAHYAGTACAEIGERMSANSYQVLKYVWRLNRKDDAKVELGKALWYLEREIFGLFIIRTNSPIDRDFVFKRTAAQPSLTIYVALALLDWNLTGKVKYLIEIKSLLTGALRECS